MMLETLQEILKTTKGQTQQPLDSDILEKWVAQRHTLFADLRKERNDEGEDLERIVELMQRIRKEDRLIKERIETELAAVRENLKVLRKAKNYQDASGQGRCIDERA